MFAIRRFLVVLVAACTLAAAPPATLTVGFSQIGAESAWRTAETESIRHEAEKRGIKLSFSDAQQKQENQIKALRSFIAQKVSAIILAPVVETGWEPVLKDAKAAGIPVVLVDRGVKVTDDSLYATLIASDFVAEGSRAGEWLIAELRRRKAADDKGSSNVVELQGTVGSAPAIDRKSGFEKAIKSTPSIKLVRSQTGDFTRAGGKQVMQAFLKASKGENFKIHAVYAHNDDMALGAIHAIEEEGLKPGKDIVIVSIDGVKAAFEALAAGKLNCVVECNPLLGPAAFDAVEKVVKGATLPKKIVVEDRLFQEKDAAVELPKRAY